MAGDTAFPAALRLKSLDEFQRVYARKRSASDDWLIVYVCENTLGHARLGVSVSRKVGGAVLRNRYKRLFREAFRLCRSQMPDSIDLIIIPRTTPEPPSMPQVRESLIKLAAQATRKLSSSPRHPRPSEGPAS